MRPDYAKPLYSVGEPQQQTRMPPGIKFLRVLSDSARAYTVDRNVDFSVVGDFIEEQSKKKLMTMIIITDRFFPTTQYLRLSFYVSAKGGILVEGKENQNLIQTLNEYETFFRKITDPAYPQ